MEMFRAGADRPADKIGIVREFRERAEMSYESFGEP